MSEATEAPATPEPTVSSNEEIAQDPLFDKLAETVTGLVAETTTEAKPDEAAEAKSDPGEEEPETPAEDDWDDLSNDRPWTEERHKKVADQHRADRRKIGKLFTKLTDQRGKLKAQREQVRNEKRQIEIVTTSVMNDLRAMREGTPEQAVSALGRLAQSDPHTFYEHLSLAMLGKAPQRPKEDPKVAALEAKIDRLEKAAVEREQSQTESQQVTAAQERAIEVLKSKEEWPLLAGRAEEAPEQVAREFWQLYMQQSRAAGRYIDIDSFADRIERKLRLQSMPSHRAKQNGATGSGPDREQETRATANPETAHSPPRSISPSQSALSGGARRAATEQELAADLVSNAPQGFFEQFGSFG